ncbi:MAG: U32 family peptidase [Promethearchaeota archaeon]|nr:MAG: U32 family peptidase [Candidatus Lokiarchaeota archaeon]
MEVLILNKVELLSPAKNMKAVKAAVNNSDAVYFGIKGFNMRERADNFELKDLKRVVDFLHDRNTKAILATNILVYDHELENVQMILESAVACEIDAVIVCDLATVQMAKDIGIKFHISTQCNVSNSMAAKFYEGLGAERIILARECSLEKIKTIAGNLKRAGVEAFCHGAMCTAISGRCYFSATICGDSANRGKCIQPCRRSWTVIDNENNEFIYDGVRFMNSRDLCMVHHIPEMIESGINCLKIEGRMRSPHYVDVVSSIYRKAIEAYYNSSFSKNKASNWIRELRKVYNRGFTTGFYFKRPTESAHQHVSPTNLSHYRLILMGTIKDYDSNSRLATISLTNGKLKKNMELIITSDDTETYFRQKISSIKFKGREVKKTGHATPREAIEVQVKMKNDVVPQKDKIYLFTNKTYKNRYLLKAKKGKVKKSEFYRLRKNL